MAAAAHFIHWRLAGRTLTPVEPSEAMQTLEEGLLNAGFVLFGLATLSTLILGRWFCGWACHVVALQDLCTWLLKKIGVRPRPLRSRLLVFVPLLAALYMFAWPSMRRWWWGGSAPALVRHFTTEDFWTTFPGVWISLLTLVVCGFLIVYLLGNKGFCTYACPYGGVFGVADRVAPGKIRVTEDCDGCAHCTATCTSNVRVHEEVRRFGMVVDPGCMKCTDCVSVCPKDALYFGFGRPSIAAGKPGRKHRTRRYDYTWPEELGLVACFAIALYAFRGLYDAVPFLLALGLSAICAFLLVQAARLLYVPALRLQHWQLRLKGRITPAGWAFGCVALALTTFIGHCVLVQYHAREGQRWLARARVLQATAGGRPDPTVVESALRGRAHLAWARRYGLFESAKIEAQLGAVALFLGQPDQAAPYLQRALEIAPGYAAARHKWAELLARRGEMDAAVTELKRTVHSDPGLAEARHDLIGALRRLGRLPEAVAVLDEAVARRGHDVAARLELAGVLAETGRTTRGLEEARRVVAERPQLAEGHFRLGLILAAAGRLDEALLSLQQAVARDPDSVPRRVVLGRLALEDGRVELALNQLSAARRLAPLDPQVLRLWARALASTRRLYSEIARLQQGAADDPAARYGLAFMYAEAGDDTAARGAYQQAAAQLPGLSPP